MKNGANYPKGSYGKGIKIVNVKDLFKGRFVPDNELDELKENILKDDSIYTVEHGDILFTRSSLVRSGAGMCAMINNPNQKILFCGFIIRFRIFEKNRFYPLYLLYMLRSPAYRALFTGSQQTCITNINQDTLGDIEVYIPIDENGDIDFNKQVELVNSLNSIDDKIALNNKTNSELEKMAKTVYDYWFTQFDFPDANGNPYKTSGGKMEYNQVLKREIPAGWEVGKLGFFLEKFGDGIHGTPEYDEDGEYYFINGNNLGNKLISFGPETLKVNNTEYQEIKRPITDNSILLSINGTLGSISFYNGEKIAIGKSACFLNVKDKKSKPFVYQILSSEKFQKYMYKVAGGSTIKNFAPKQAADYDIIIPPIELLEKFNEIASFYLIKQIKQEKENEELTKLRDYLLPLLMNGQIEVK